MNYPVWDLPWIGGSLLIDLVATLHVFVSHFAVGGGLFLVIWETRARRAGDAARLDYLKRHSLFFILVTLVFGAISGVGIWFSIQLISPVATSSLIHTFVWGWAIEWVFFFVEIAAALIYYYAWDRLDARRHLIVGWIYFVAAFASLVIINGIITFMLTPGAWLESGAFWDGFFNPTYWPSLLLRTGLAGALAGLYALLTLSARRDEALRGALREAGVWALAGLLIAALSVPWYRAQLLPEQQELLAGAWPLAALAAAWTWILAAVVAALALAFAVLRPAAMRPALAGFMMLLALGSLGGFEMTRELVRKPYVIWETIYSSSAYVDEMEGLRERGLGAARWSDPAATDAYARGREVFRMACVACHTEKGYRGMRGYLADYDLQRFHALGAGFEDLRWRPGRGRRRVREHDRRGRHGVHAAFRRQRRGTTDARRVAVGAPERGRRHAMNPMDLVPTPDRAPLPAPLWMLQLLLLLTFLLHLLPMNLLLTGAGLQLWSRIRGRDAKEARLGRELAKIQPVLVSATVTLGVAPLLFLQVIYGQFFYSSSVLVGTLWMLVIPLLILAYYALYRESLKGAPLWMIGFALLAMLYTGFMLAYNSSLMLDPGLWWRHYATSKAGDSLAFGGGLLGATFLWRWLHVMSGALAVGGLGLFVLARRRESDDESYAAFLKARSLKLFVVGTAAAVLLGFMQLVALPEGLRERLFKGDMLGGLPWMLSLPAALAALPLLARAARRPGAGAGPAFTLTGLVLALMVWQRHALREQALDQLADFRAAELAVAPQWGVLALFAFLFVAGLITLAWMLSSLRAR